MGRTDWREVPTIPQGEIYIFDEPEFIEDAQERLDQALSWYRDVEAELDNLNSQFKLQKPSPNQRGFRAARVANMMWLRAEITELYRWLLKQEGPMGLALLDFMKEMDEKLPDSAVFDLESFKALERFVPDPLSREHRRRPHRTPHFL